MDLPETSGFHDSLGSLTAREREILEMASRGLSNRQIASELSVTVHAVKFHLGSIFRKLGVSNRTEAAVKFARAGETAVPARYAG